MWYLILGSLVAGAVAVAGTGTGVAVMPWNLPVFPATSPPPRPLHLKFERNETVSEEGRAYAKKIPRLLWIAVRDAKDKLSSNLNYQMLPLFNRNPLWDVHIADNDEKDDFMKTAFAGTSLLWAYNIINSRAGAAKADIWRYAVLWAYGGAYIDDDSDIGTPLDSMIGVEDTLVVAYEKNGFDGNTCYVPRYHLSDFSTKKRFGPGLNNYEHGAKANEIFYTRILLNWAIISAPRHPILIRTMENLVEVIRSDFLREPVLRYLKLDYRWRLVMCATGPSMMTASARELVLEQLFARGPNSTSDVMDSVLNREDIRRVQLVPFTYKLASTDFKDYGGRFKAVSNRPRDNPNHYMNMHKNKWHGSGSNSISGAGGWNEVGLLANYVNESAYDSSVLDFLHRNKIPIQGQNGKEIFVIEFGQKRGIPNWDTFVGLNLTMSDVHVASDYKVDAIPLGDAIPKQIP